MRYSLQRGAPEPLKVDTIQSVSTQASFCWLPAMMLGSLGRSSPSGSLTPRRLVLPSPLEGRLYLFLFLAFYRSVFLYLCLSVSLSFCL